MIDFYYEFPEGSKVFDQPVRYGLLRGWHPDQIDSYQHTLHSQCYVNASRIWLENANGVYQIKPDWYGMRGHVDPREFTMIKLKSRVYKWWFDES